MFFLLKNYEEAQKYYIYMESNIEMETKKYDKKTMTEKWNNIIQTNINEFLYKNTWTMKYNTISKFASYYSRCENIKEDENGTNIYSNIREEGDLQTLFIIHLPKTDTKKIDQAKIKVWCNEIITIDRIVKCMDDFIEIRIKPFPIRYACNARLSISMPVSKKEIQTVFLLNTVLPIFIKKQLFTNFKRGSIIYDDYIVIKHFGITW
jgi:uncharacterized protein YggL (DUF469 family)